MADVTITVSGRRNLPGIGRRRVRATITHDGGTYVTNGTALTPENLGLARLDYIDVHPAAGYVFEYDYANEKVKTFYGDYSQGSDGVLVEFPNGTALSAATRVFAVGE